MFDTKEILGLIKQEISERPGIKGGQDAVASKYNSQDKPPPYFSLRQNEFPAVYENGYKVIKYPEAS